MLPVRLLGLIGAFSLAVLITADLVLVWSPVRDLDIVRAATGKSDRRVVVGSLLGVFAIPGVFAGLAYLWTGLAPAGPWIALPPIVLAGIAYVVGAGFHAACGPVMVAIRDTPASARDASSTLAVMRRIFDVLRTALWITIFASALGLFAAVASGRTAFPRWTAAVSPLPLVLAFRVATRIAPPAVAGALVPAGGNLATLVFLIVALAVLPR
jgi:hypothetical protein